MKLLILVLPTLLAANASAFVTPSTNRRPGWVNVATKVIAGDVDAMAEQRLDDIARRLKLQVYDTDTGVYGFESKDPLYGIQTIHTFIEMDVHGHLGLTLVSDSTFLHQISGFPERPFFLANTLFFPFSVSYSRPKSRTPISTAAASCLSPRWTTARSIVPR
jgi:hypothetical protein